MRRRHFTQTALTLATAAVLVLAGCRSHREATRPPLPPPTDSVVATVQEAEPPAAPPCRIARLYATVQGTRVDGQLRSGINTASCKDIHIVCFSAEYMQFAPLVRLDVCQRAFQVD
ncbi:MAG: hypothetical protein IKS44_07140, partial [Bacteroidales bacterium]|nr:hypothetical protein [Bacteroidales bacterium]